MQSSNWNLVKKELISIAHAFDLPITENRIRWYIEMWKDMQPGQVLDGLRKWAMNTRARRLPLPGEIKDGISGEEVAGRILQAVRRFGYTNPDGARAYLGDVWRAVELMGGWKNICESKADRGVFIAQTRDLWNKIEVRSNYGAHQQRISGSDEPKNIQQGAGGGLAPAVRELLESARPPKLDGPEDPTDKES